jgi:hypothetical protein
MTDFSGQIVIGVEELCLLVYSAVYSGESPQIWPPSSKQETDNRILRVPCFILIFCLAYFSDLRIKAIFSSETSVDIHLATRRWIPEIELFMFTAVRTSNPTPLNKFENYPLATCSAAERSFYGVRKLILVLLLSRLPFVASILP